MVSSQILTKPLPYLALILAHIIWGANFVVAKITLQEFPPMSLAFLRFSFACLFLAPFFIAQKTHSSSGIKKIKISKKDLPKLIAVGTLIITLNIAFFFEGIKRTSAINASALTLIIPLLSVILGWWFLKEKVSLLNLAGVGLAGAGALIILGLPQLLMGDFNPNMLIGNVLIILASISWVLGAVISKQLLKKYSSLTVTAVAFLVGTITMFTPATLEYLQNPGWSSNVTFLGLLGLTYMILLSSISAYFLFEWGLSKTSVWAADLFQYIEPFVASILAISILEESISNTFLIGASLIALGAFLGTLSKPPNHRPHKFHRT